MLHVAIHQKPKRLKPHQKNKTIGLSLNVQRGSGYSIDIEKSNVKV